ncbi:hypothetical protein OG21DRAFT_645341 [Imleria badia]|nr:hypothetical protein OG21DRAFT_645341 [Imleria badia]
MSFSRTHQQNVKFLWQSVASAHRLEIAFTEAVIISYQLLTVSLCRDWTKLALQVAVLRPVPELFTASGRGHAPADPGANIPAARRRRQTLILYVVTVESFSSARSYYCARNDKKALFPVQNSCDMTDRFRIWDV